MNGNPTQPAVDLAVGDLHFDLVFDFEAIADAEELTGRPLLTGLTTRDINMPRINTVRAMFFACARARRPDLTYDAAKGLINRNNIASVWGKVLEAWSTGITDETESAAAPPDPTTGHS